MTLLGLPAEVRRRILESCFEGHRLSWDFGSSYNCRVPPEHLSLLFLCKKTYDESRSLMLATAQVDITNMVDFDYGVLHPAVFDVSLLRDVYLQVAGSTKEWKTTSFGDLLRRLSSLRSFTFCYDDSIYNSETVVLKYGISKADLDFIEQHPERILGDEKNVSSQSGPLQNIELHRVEPFTDRMVTVWKQRQRSFKLIAEFTIVYDSVVDQISGVSDFTELTYGIGSFDLETQVATIHTTNGPAKQYQFNITRFEI